MSTRHSPKLSASFLTMSGNKQLIVQIRLFQTKLLCGPLQNTSVVHRWAMAHRLKTTDLVELHKTEKRSHDKQYWFKYVTRYVYNFRFTVAADSETETNFLLFLSPIIIFAMSFITGLINIRQLHEVSLALQFDRLRCAKHKQQIYLHL